MMRTIFLGWTALVSLVAFGQESDNPPLRIQALNPDSVSSFENDTGWYSIENGAMATYSNIVLKASSLKANLYTKEAVAEGNVQLWQEGQLWKSERMRYNFDTRNMEADNFRVGQSPFYSSGHQLTLDLTNRVYRAVDARITTDDAAKPAFYIQARELEMRPNDYFLAKGASLRIGGVPVFYLPSFRKDLSKEGNRFDVSPGMRSRYGGFLLNSYTWYEGDSLSARLHGDLYTRRGVGVGQDFEYDLGRWGQGELTGYYIEDQNPDEDVPGDPIPSDRYRVRFGHQLDLREYLRARVVYSDLSDPYFNRDFFEGEHKDNPQPSSYLEMEQLTRNHGYNLFVRPQVDGFFETVERLPEFKWNAYRQQIGTLPVYYESESSAGWLRRRFADGDPRRDFEAMRVDTMHQWVAPRTFWGWLTATPKAGVRFTHYGESHGPGAATLEENRWVYNTGIEFSTKASRVWKGARSRFWNVDGLRHIVSPIVNYVHVPSPNKKPRELPQFDPILPSLRLLPIDFPDFNAVDAIDARDVIRFGLRNKFQTHRDGISEDLVHWALYTDWRLNPETGQPTFSDLYSDMDLQPREWLLLTSELQFDMHDAQWTQANHRLTLLPGDTWNWAFGHRYLRDDFAGTGIGNNLFYSSLYYKFNENWGTRLTQQFEARDGVLEEHSYAIYRDLRSWTASLIFRVRDRREGATDYSVGVRFSFKAFPRFNLGSDRDRARPLFGG